MQMKMMEKETEEEIEKAYELFMDNKENGINFESLKRVSEMLEENITDEELQIMISESKTNKNIPNISKEEFKRFHQKKSTAFPCLCKKLQYFDFQSYKPQICRPSQIPFRF